MSLDAILALGILAGAVMLFVSEKYPIDFVALFVLGALLLLGLVTPLETGDTAEWPTMSERKRLTRQWAQLIRRVYEAGPLLCECRAQMRILSFITDPPVVTKILRPEKSAVSHGLRIVLLLLVGRCSCPRLGVEKPPVAPRRANVLP